jgi:menaquinone-9 beta-reductase
VKVAVVGGGPGGALAAFHLAQGGAEVTVFDASHPREKPCGGGLTARALALLPPAQVGDPLPARLVRSCRFDSGAGEYVDVPLERDVAIASRRALDAWILRRATNAGARHVPERVVAVDAGGGLATAPGRRASLDVIVGADGATSLVRRTLLSPIPAARLEMALGWYAAGTSEMLVRFTPGLPGYLWLFPRPDHVGVGLCAPLQAVPTRRLWERLEHEVARAFPALSDLEAERYAATIPGPSADPSSILEIAGERWALVGDAAALADPLTGEGITYALGSGKLLAETLLAGDPPTRYPERVLEAFGRDLVKAAALRERFYAPGFTSRMVRYAAASGAIRDVLGDLVLGDQGYRGLKRRLLRKLPAFVVQAAAYRLGLAA